MKPLVAVIFGLGMAFSFAAQTRAQDAQGIAACQKDMITHCAEHMRNPEGLKACLIQKREKMAPECQKMLQQAR